MSFNLCNDDDAMDTSSPRRSTSGEDDTDTIFVDEYNAWRQTDRQSIKLRGTKTDDDGKTSLEFSIEASEQKFILHCPCHYPNYLISDDNFFVEADSDLQMWCNALNEFLLDTDGQLTLSAILDKGLSLYSSADARARSREVSMSSAFNDDYDEADYEEVLDNVDEEEEAPNDDDQLEDILDNDLSWELEIGRRKKRWRTKEAQLRAERQKHSDCSGEDRSMQQLYHDPSIKGRQPKQVPNYF